MRQRRKMSVATKIKKGCLKSFHLPDSLFYKYLVFFRLIFFSQMIFFNNDALEPLCGCI